MNKTSLHLEWPLYVLIGLILLAQGTWLFLDARRRGGKAWFWGLWGFIQFPWPTVTYLILIWWKKRKRNRATPLTEE